MRSMPSQMHVLGVTAEHRPIELGSFRLGLGLAAWSRDREALFVPTLRLNPGVVRQIVSGQGSLFRILQGASLAEVQDGRLCFDPHLITFVWGDFMLYRVGEPEARDVVFLRGRIGVPDLMTVNRYRGEMTKQRSLSL
jgi:hypothetical protein